MAEPDDYISYEEFGKRFFALAVSEERILGAVNMLAGEPIDVGPIGVGPGRIAKVTATGAIGQAVATRIDGDDVSYRVVLPVNLVFELNLQVDTHRFHADLEVPLVLTARAADPLQVFIEIAAPRPKEVVVKLRAEGLRASVLSKAVGVEGELQRFVAKYVGREVNKPAIVRARTVNVGGSIDAAWATISPAQPKEPPGAVIQDLENELEREIAENPLLGEDLVE
ncbi:MAG: hypothetical protein ABIR57_07555 [Aeromicrobium sp.]